MTKQRLKPERLAEWRQMCEQRQYCPEHNPDGVPDAPLAPECEGCWPDDTLLQIALALLTEVERLRGRLAPTPENVRNLADQILGFDRIEDATMLLDYLRGENDAT